MKQGNTAADKSQDCQQHVVDSIGPLAPVHTSVF